MSVDENIRILPKQPVHVPKLAIAAIVLLMAGVIAMIYIRSKPSSSQEAVPGQELVIGVDRVTLYVPKDAATLTGVISISSLESNLYPIADEKPEWFRSQVVDVQYLNRDGVPYGEVNFSKPALICFMIKELWLDYTQHPDEYEVQYYVEKQDPPGWVTLPLSAHADRYQLCGQTDHLSIFALAVVPGKEIPLTGGILTPTSTGFLSPTPTVTINPAFSSTPTKRGGAAATPVSTRAAPTSINIPPTGTNIPPTGTNIPPTVVPPTVVPPTVIPPTNPPPPTDPPTEPPPPTDPPVDPTDPPADPTDPPVIDPPIIELPPLLP